MKDFTLHTYRLLLLALKKAGYVSLTFEEYCNLKNRQATPAGKFVILRHDVDLKAVNSLHTAKIESELGLKASYYFRVVPESNQPDIIRRIAALGHEIGYHYEDMAIANGDMQAAIGHFENWLKYFRSFYPVKTICMHGAPTSRFDGRDLWKQYNYHDYGIIGEPYFDVDFSQVAYLTDTGRRWDGYKVSLRDKIPQYQDEWIRRGWTFTHTPQLIQWLHANDNLPNLMLTTHPQRWTDNRTAWWKEWILQHIKNLVKRLLVALK